MQDRPVNRRGLVATIAGGTILGGLWGVAFQTFAREERPTVAVVGHRHAQIALIESHTARVLILLGEPDDRLLEQLPAMMTLFRQRIALVIGSEAALAASASSIRDRWLADQVVAFQAKTRVPNLPVPTVAVTEPIEIGLNGGATLICRPGHRGDWRTPSPPGDTPIWSVELQHSGPSIIFAPDARSLISTDVPSATLVITPDIPQQATFRQTTASAWAVNYDGVDSGMVNTDAVAVTRTYPEDISRFTLAATGITSPPWTLLPQEQESQDD